MLINTAGPFNFNYRYIVCLIRVWLIEWAAACITTSTRAKCEWCIWAASTSFSLFIAEHIQVQNNTNDMTITTKIQLTILHGYDNSSTMQTYWPVHKCFNQCMLFQ